MAPSGTLPRRLPRLEREQQILDLAHAQFAREGYSAVTMDGVAAAAGVTKPLLYNYFGNKERLYLSCLGRTGEALVETFGRALEGAANPGDGLKAGLRSFLEFVEGDRGSWQVLYDETLPRGGEIASEVSSYRDELLALVAKAVLDLSPARSRADHVEAEAVAHALLGGVESIVRWWLRTDTLSATEVADLYIDAVEPGLGRRALAGLPQPPSRMKTRRPNS